MYALILKICIAHLLGDFVFQSDKMVSGIKKNKLKSGYLYLHILIHLLFLLLVTAFETKFFVAIFILSISHLIIDIITKIIFSKYLKAITCFFIDQTLHFISIGLFIYYFFPFYLKTELLFNNQTLLLIICLILLTKVSSVIIRKTMSLFSYEVNTNGLPQAGKYIGILERLFIFSFIIFSFWDGIGFLLAAKSIFRFGDLKNNKEIKLTEYILIGTLISFGLAIIIGKLFSLIIFKFNDSNLL